MKVVIIQLLKYFLGITLLFPSWALADQAWPIITFTCDTVKNEVKIKNEVKWGEKGKNFPFNAKQGTYNPWELVVINERKGRSLVSERATLTLDCQLKATKYTFVVRPKIFNVNAKAKCGNRLSFIVSIYKEEQDKKEQVLIENKPMERFCHGNAPVLRGIKVKGDTGKIKYYEVSRSKFY